MPENTMVGFFMVGILMVGILMVGILMVGILMAESVGESRKDPISLAFNAGRSEQDNASPRLFHDTIQLLQQLLLFTDNAMHGATFIPFKCHSSSGLLTSALSWCDPSPHLRCKHRWLTEHLTHTLTH